MIYEFTKFVAIEGERVDDIFAAAKEVAKTEVVYVHYYELEANGKVASDFEYWIYKTLRMEYDGVATYVVYVDGARETTWSFTAEDEPVERMKALADLQEKRSS